MKRLTFTHSNDLTVFERLRYEKSLEKGQVQVIGYEGILSRCFSDESDIEEFIQNLSNLPHPPTKFTSDPGHGIDIKAVWEFSEPISVTNDEELVSQFEKICNQLNRNEYCYLYVFLQLVTQEILGSEKGKPIYVRKISPLAKLGKARQIMFECKIDSFDDVKLSEIPKCYRKIWVDKILNCLRESDCNPVDVKFEDDGLLVKWKHADARFVWDLIENVLSRSIIDAR